MHNSFLQLGECLSWKGISKQGYQNYLAAASSEINITYPIADRDRRLTVFSFERWDRQLSTYGF